MKLLYFAMELANAEDEMLKFCENDFEKMKFFFWIKMCITFCFFSPDIRLDGTDENSKPPNQHFRKL